MNAYRFSLFAMLMLVLTTGSFAQPPQYSLVPDGATPTDKYDLRIWGLTELERLYPEEEGFEDPRYEIFVEWGDGSFSRHQVSDLDPDDPGTPDLPQVSLQHRYNLREPKLPNTHVTITPLYSRNTRPVHPDRVSPPSIPWSPNFATSTFSFVPKQQAVKVDLNWKQLEPDDDFVVIAGFADRSSLVPLSNGGFISIYYNNSKVHPKLDDGGNYIVRSHYAGIQQTESLNIESDQVITTSEGALNSQIDFEIPEGSASLSQGLEELLFMEFVVNDPSQIELGDQFQITVVLRANDRGTPSTAYEFDSVTGVLVAGKDPNAIIGSPRPFCMDSLNFIDYKITFYNEGTAAVSDFTIHVTFSEYVALAAISDVEILSLRIGDTYYNTTDLATLPEMTAANPPGFTWQMNGLGGILLGYQDPFIDQNPNYYEYCSAELLIRVPRNPAITSCENIPARLDIIFPGDTVSQVDTLICGCGVPPDPTEFPCNIVPDIPLLGGCWCTLLLIVLLAVIVMLVIVIWRNSNRPQA